MKVCLGDFSGGGCLPVSHLSYRSYKTFIAINVMSSGCLCSLK